jgi:glycosyltransferase involved in cell wall biosynthesis
MYRTEVLPYIDMNPPGLVIEDFNMTFEVYQKKLGKVGFTLGAVAVTQDPDNFGDYVRQTRRWAVGLWQTVRRHPPRANLFTAMLTVLLLELVTSSVLFLLLPLLLTVLLIPDVAGGAPAWPMFTQVYAVVTVHVRLSAVLFGILIPDLALTCVAAAAERQPRLLVFAPFYPVMRLVDAAIGLWAIPVAWLTRANGRWRSPARRAVSPAARKRARRLLGLPEHAMVVGAVGRLAYQKAPEDFLAALRALRRPGVVGVWVGGGELAGRVARLAAAQPHAPVMLTGERNDVPALLPAFDVFTLPSWYEGLPTAVVEAMLCGVPVVATAVNAVGDLVVPGETGLLVPPRRPDLLAGAIRSLLDSPADAARMAAAARARLGTRYTVPALRDALEAAYAIPESIDTDGSRLVA